MKVKKIALLGASVLFLAGGISTAFAMNHTSANQSYSQHTDGAVVLNWGTNSVADVSSLTSVAYVYRSVVLANPSTTHSADQTGNAVLTFTLSVPTDEASTKGLNGVSVALYKDKTVATVQAGNMEGNVKKTTRGVTPDKTVTLSNSQTYSIAVTTNADVPIVLEFDYDGTAQDTGKTLGGQLSVAVTYSAA